LGPGWAGSWEGERGGRVEVSNEEDSLRGGCGWNGECREWKSAGSGRSLGRTSGWALREAGMYFFY
jgi:hypothetical protein